MAEPQSKAIFAGDTRLPARHGLPWSQEELCRLIEDVGRGLNLDQLADSHQRTRASISAAAARLIPQQLRPSSRNHSVAVLANYLRDAGCDELQAVDAASVDPVVQSVPERASRVPHTDSVECSDGVAPTNAKQVQAGGAEVVFTSEVVGRADPSDIAMLVIAAVENLAAGRDRDVLSMRLGLNGHPMTLAEIGHECGISRERVRQIQERALARLAARARSHEAPGAVIRRLLVPACAPFNALESWLIDAARSGFEISLELSLKFILRAAGFPKAEVAKIVTLLSEFEGSQRAKLRALAPSSATAKRVERVVNAWLMQSDWPDHVRMPPLSEQLTAQRDVQESDIAGHFQSGKLGRMVHYESGLELEILTVLEQSEQVAYYQEQPVVIPYTFRNGCYRYYPDLLVATTDGRCLLIEVKPTDGMALSINRAKSLAGRAWAHARGWGWLVMNDRHTYRQIAEHEIPAAIWSLLDNELRVRGALTWRDMLSLRTQHGFTRFDLTAYIIQSGAELDRGYRVTAPKS